MVPLHVLVEEYSTFSTVERKRKRGKEMEEMVVVVVVMAVIVEDMRLHLLATVLPLQVMALPLQVMVLPLQAMGLLVATEDFSSYQGIKETKTKIRATEAVIMMVEGTCVIAMALPLLAMGLHPMNLPHLMMHHLTMPQLIQLLLHHTVLLLHHIVLLLHPIALLLLHPLVLLPPLVLLHLFPPPPAGRWLKHSMSPALRNSAL